MIYVLAFGPHVLLVGAVLWLCWLVYSLRRHNVLLIARCEDAQKALALVTDERDQWQRECRDAFDLAQGIAAELGERAADFPQRPAFMDTANLKAEEPCQQPARAMR